MLTTRIEMALLTGLLVPLSAGCATKSFVAESVEERAAVIEGRVTAVERSVEDVADDTRTNTARRGEVDQTATTALDTARSADTSARGADSAASEAITRVRSLEAANRQLLFEIVLSEDHGQFRFADTALPEPAASSLDALVTRVRDSDTSAHFEIEGHTDETGPAEYNHRLGLERAESVRLYLHEHHRLPLHKINVISYGETKPIVPNDSADGRAKNRRVVVRVLHASESENRPISGGQDQE